MSKLTKEIAETHRKLNSFLLQQQLQNKPFNKRSFISLLREVEDKIKELEEESGSTAESVEFKLSTETLWINLLRANGSSDELAAHEQTAAFWKQRLQEKKSAMNGEAPKAQHSTHSSNNSRKNSDATPPSRSSFGAEPNPELLNILNELRQTEYISETTLKTIEETNEKLNGTFTTADDFFDVSLALTTITEAQIHCLAEFSTTDIAEKTCAPIFEKPIGLLKRAHASIKNSLEKKLVSLIQEINTCPEDKRAAIVSRKLFSDLYGHSEKINRQYKKLILLFHPDKITQEEYTSLFSQFFHLLTASKETALIEAGTSVTRSLTAHEQKGDEYLEKSKRSTASSSSEIFSSTKWARLAFAEYILACQAIDAEKKSALLSPRNTKAMPQIRIHKKISETLLQIGDLLEAQIYVVGAIRIFLASSSGSEQTFNELCVLLRKIQMFKSPPQITSLLLKAIDDHPDIPYKLSPYGSMSGNTQRANLVGEDMKQLISEKLTNDSTRLSSYLASRSITGTDSKQEESHKVSKKTDAVQIMLTTITATVITALSQLSLTKNNILLTDFEKRIEKALDLYRKGKYQDFLNELGKPYPHHPGLFSVYVENTKIEVAPKELLSKLLIDYQLRPDGAAHLLNLIGEALLSPSIRFTETLHLLLQISATQIFYNLIEDKSLGLKAKTFDELVSAKTAEPMYCFDRIKEAQFVATLNLALTQIMMGHQENLEFALKRVQQAKTEIQENPHYSLVAEQRLALVEHFLFALGLNPSPQQSGSMLAIESTPREIVQIDNKEINIRSFPLDASFNESTFFDLLGECTDNTVSFSKQLLIETLDSIQGISALALKEKFEKHPLLRNEVFSLENLDLLFQITNVEFKPCLLRTTSRQTVCEPLLNSPKPKEGAIGCVYLVFETSQATEPHSAFINQDHTYIPYLEKRKTLAKDNPSLLNKLQFQLACAYRASALENSSENWAKNSPQQWEQAAIYYEKVLRKEPQNIEAQWGLSESAIHMGLYDEATATLNKLKPPLNQSPEYYYYHAIIAYKKQTYPEAETLINKAIDAAPVERRLALSKTRELITRFTSKRIRARTEAAKERPPEDLSCDKLYFLKRHDSPSNYNILALDKGGVLGIVPLVLLAEFEARAHRPISHIFNMIAGMSMQGAAALGLALPKMTDTTERSTYEPKFSAGNVLKSYSTRGDQLFSRSSTNLIPAFLSSKKNSRKYTDTGREGLFRRYFSTNAHLNCLLTEVVVPIVKSYSAKQSTFFSHTHNKASYLFTRHSAKTMSHTNYSVVNVAMATTASPNLFPEHEISYADEETESFMDGGLLARSPAEYALTHAQALGVKNDTVLLWSLGTGLESPFRNRPGPDPEYRTEPSIYNLGKKVEEFEMNKRLSGTLKDDYYRTNFWLDRKIEVDDVSPATIEYLTSVGEQLIEEMDESDANTLNTLVEKTTLKMNF